LAEIEVFGQENGGHYYKSDFRQNRV